MQQSISAAIYALSVNLFFQAQYRLGQRARLMMAALDRLPMPVLLIVPRIQTAPYILG